MNKQHFIMMMSLILLACPESVHGMERLQGLLGIQNPSGQTNTSSLVPVAAGVAVGVTAVAVGKLVHHHYRASARHAAHRKPTSASQQQSPQDMSGAQGGDASSSAQPDPRLILLNKRVHALEMGWDAHKQYVADRHGKLSGRVDGLDTVVAHRMDAADDRVGALGQALNVILARQQQQFTGQHNGLHLHLVQLEEKSDNHTAQLQKFAENSTQVNAQLDDLQALASHVQKLDARVTVQRRSIDTTMGRVTTLEHRVGCENPAPGTNLVLDDLNASIDDLGASVANLRGGMEKIELLVGPAAATAANQPILPGESRSVPLADFNRIVTQAQYPITRAADEPACQSPRRKSLSRSESKSPPSVIMHTTPSAGPHADGDASPRQLASGSPKLMRSSPPPLQIAAAAAIASVASSSSPKTSPSTGSPKAAAKSSGPAHLTETPQMLTLEDLSPNGTTVIKTENVLGVLKMQ